MSANSLLRRALKLALYPIMSEHVYQCIQSLAKAWDIRRGSWAEPELELIPYAVNHGETAIDIGANYGLYSYHLSRAVGSKGRVVAFEPVAFTCGALRRVQVLLGLRNMEIVPMGCSDK